MLLLVAVGFFGCGGAKSATRLAAPGVEHAPSPAASAVAVKRAVDAAHAPAPSHRVATITKNALGPFVARVGGIAVAAWIAPAETGSGQELIAVPLAADGSPLSEPHLVVRVPEEATSLVVRPSGAPSGGWLVAWSALLDRGESLTVLGLGQDAAARGTPVDVARTSDHVKWCDLIPTSQGAVAVWAEETRSGDANVLTSAIDGEGKPLGMPVRVARGVDRWQALAVDDGVGLALVTNDPADPHASAGRLGWLPLDAQGHAKGAAVAIGARPTVSGDIDAASVPEGVVLAWTDRTGEDAQVVIALVDRAGHVAGPIPAMSAVGGASLVALASGPRMAVLAWEEPSAHTHPRHALHLAAVSASSAGALSAQSVTALEIAPGADPELTAAGDGFALFAPAHACMGGAAPGACAGPVVPTFVRFDARLEPVQTEPVVLGEENAPTSLGWGLRCAGERCFAMAATGVSPTPIFVVDLEPRASPFATPLAAPIPADAPRVTSLETIATGPAFDDVTALRLGDATVVTTLAGSPAAGDASERRRSRGDAVTVRVIDDDGQPRGTLQTLTSRALPASGITIAPGGTSQDGAAVAWVTGHDDQDRQVHVAHLDRAGRRNHEIELTTRAKGDVSGIAMAWAGDGWLVAWVDARDGNGEVYATKIDRDLTRVAREERITNAPGDAGDVALAVHGDLAWLAWSDPRESPREGLADIYATTLRTADARRAGDEVRVLASAPHSRSPQLATTSGDGVEVAWIEDAATGLEGPGAAMIARLDRDAHVVRPATILPLTAPGRPTSIVLSPSRDGVRVVIVRSGAETLSLESTVIGADGLPASPPWPLLDLEAPSSFDVALAFAGDALVFDDAGATAGEHLVRRAQVAWRR